MKKVEIELILERGQTWPDYQINLPKVAVHDIDDCRIVTHRGQTQELTIDYKEKLQSETVVENGVIVRDQSIKISNIWIDGIKIHARMLDQLGLFKARYRDDYIEFCQQHNIEVVTDPFPARQFWHAGTWNIALDELFWHRYRQQRSSSLNDDFNGYSNLSTLLQPLKDLLN